MKCLDPRSGYGRVGCPCTSCWDQWSWHPTRSKSNCAGGPCWSRRTHTSFDTSHRSTIHIQNSYIPTRHICSYHDRVNVWIFHDTTRDPRSASSWHTYVCAGIFLPSRTRSCDRNHESVVPQSRFEIMERQGPFSSQEQDEAAEP